MRMAFEGTDLKEMPLAVTVTSMRHCKNNALLSFFTAQMRIQKARAEIDKRPWLTLKRESKAEFGFWKKLREVCLLPEQAAFSSSDELKSKLEELRNAALLMLGVSNIIWLTLMLSVMAQGKRLTILGTNFLGLSFLILFTLVLVVQFITLLVHRVGTWIHLISRIPFKPGSKVKMSWSFLDEDLPPNPSEEEMLETHMRLSNRLSNHRRKKSIKRESRKLMLKLTNILG